jgi:hypothetical protein
MFNGVVVVLSLYLSAFFPGWFEGRRSFAGPTLFCLFIQLLRFSIKNILRRK